MFNYLNFRVVALVVLSVALAINLFITLPWWVFGILLVLFLSVLAYGVFVPSTHFFAPTLTKATTPKKQFALTFDDGPNENTLKILDVLQNHQAKATFFVVGKQLELFPKIAERIVSEGHELANHTYSHNPWYPFLKRKTIHTEIEKTQQLIARFQPTATPLFRPPFGVLNPQIVKVLSHFRLPIIGWSIRTFDTVKSNPKSIAGKVEKKLDKGEVVLLHDTLKHTPETVNQILKDAQIKNLSCVTVSELFLLEKALN